MKRRTFIKLVAATFTSAATPPLFSAVQGRVLPGNFEPYSEFSPDVVLRLYGHPAQQGRMSSEEEVLLLSSKIETIQEYTDDMVVFRNPNKFEFLAEEEIYLTRLEAHIKFDFCGIPVKKEFTVMEEIHYLLPQDTATFEFTDGVFQLQ